MSHVALCEFGVQDLDALEAVGKELGFVLKKQSSFRWYGRFLNDWHDKRAAVEQGFDPKKFGQCEYVLQLKDHIAGQFGDYEIGVVPSLTGKGWALLYDSYGPGRKLEARAGVQLSKLKQGYSGEVARRYLVKKGYKVTKKYKENGEVQFIGHR